MDYKYSGISFALALTTFMTACDGGSRENARSGEQTARITMLTDSVGYASPDFMHVCDSLLGQTKDSMDYYELFVTKGNHYTVANPADSMLYFADRTLAFAGRCAEKGGRLNGIASRAYSLKAAYYHLMRQNNDSAIALFSEAYLCAMQSDIKENVPNIAANLGDAYIFSDNLPKAAHWYRRALYVADSLDLPIRSTASIYMGLGRIYTQLQDYPTASKYYEDAERQFDMMQPNMQTYFLNNYGNYFYFKHDYPNALRMFLKMKSHIERTQGSKCGNNSDINLCKINLADVYLNLGNTDSAKILVDEIEPFYRKYNVETALYYIGTIRIGIAISENELDKVKRIIGGEHFKYPIEQSMKSIRARYLKRYYSMTGDYRNALLLTEQEQQQKDSLEHNKMNMRSNEIMLRFTADTLKLHHEIAIEKKNEEVAAARITIAAFVLIVIIILLMCAYLIIYIRKRKLQVHFDIINLKLENARQRISPHFVFNVLNEQIGHRSSEDDGTLAELSHLIRTNLELLGKSHITLEEEMEFVDRYVMIQDKLAGNTLRYDKVITCDISKVHIPSMLVQILVENSIKHGLKCVEGEKTLTITIGQDANATTIAIEDNGPGFDCRRHTCDSTATGLKVVKQIVSLTNSNNKAKMRFNISNNMTPEGVITGCRATLTIPNGITLIK